MIGTRRAAALQAGQIVACADIDAARARHVGAPYTSTDWRDVVGRDDIDIIIVSTVNGLLAEVAVAALESGKHVLVEKPAGRTTAEIEAIIDARDRSGRLVRVGFNHRYHRALIKARELQCNGSLGDMMFVRGRYGHGGRPGYEAEWRSNPAISGGGELIDQGVHLIDLARMFLGEFSTVDGFARTYFWNAPVDDNAFLLLQTADRRAAMLHVSSTEWKNLFSLELYGRAAKLQIDGLGGSYGTERLTYYRMLPEMGPPETTIWEYPMADDSWRVELTEFFEDIRLNRPPAASLEDAHATLRIVEKIYANR